MATYHDIDMVLKDIVAINTKYKNQIDKFEASKQTATDFNILLRISIDSQTLFISKKQLCRNLIALLPSDERAGPEKKLSDFQKDYRTLVTRKKELFAIYDKTALMGGSGLSHPKEVVSNDQYLNQAEYVESKNKEALEGARSTIGETLHTGTEIAKQLEENREKIIVISGGLDEIESETTMAQKRLVIVAKRFSTDKLLIAFAVLLVLAIIGIVLWKMNGF